MTIKIRKAKSVPTTFNDITLYTFTLKAKDAVYLSYTAVRGVHTEEGAVQRVLSVRRINSVRDYVLSGHEFLNTFILNWTFSENLPAFNQATNEIKFPLIPNSAQLLDGQHRLAGLEAAMKINPEIGEKELLVSLAIGLSTRQAAAIFLNINSEQKPAPRSLIYDLFGEVESNPDHLLNRASDIADELNTASESPYLQQIKYPGIGKRVGAIDLSTVITSFKPILDSDGIFFKVKIKSLTLQKQVILNYFQAIKSFYDAAEGGNWENKLSNPFLKASGFAGAIDFLSDTLLTKCSEKKSFTIDTFKSFLQLDSKNLLYSVDIKNMDGKTARRSVRDYLESNLIGNVPDQDEYEI